MKACSRILLGCAALLFIACSSRSVYADGIVLVDIQKLVPPLANLNLQHSGNSTTESGGVRFTPNGDVSFGDISAGPNHQHTVSLTDLGITRASDLGVLLNINEAEGGNKNLLAANKSPLTVNLLRFTAYNQTGIAVFSADLINNSPLTLDQFKHGIGSNSDYFIFGLDPEAAARLQAAMNQDANLRLGLEATLTNVDGGPERFAFGANPAAVPEPTTMVLLGTGLAGIAGAVRRRRKAAATKTEEAA